MRGAIARRIAALTAAAALGVSCGWPEFGFDPQAEGERGGAGGSAGDAGGAGESGQGGTARGGSSQGGAGGGGAGSAGAPSAGEGGADAGAAGEGGAPGSCGNGVIDPPETDRDCGGGVCPGCPALARCELTSDCAERICTSRGICEPSSCGNQAVDGQESDRDCGGGECEARCELDAACREGTDCQSGLCQETRCADPGCDPLAGACGSTLCRCANGRDCTTNPECASGNCEGGTCAPGPRAYSRNDGGSAPGSGSLLFSLVIRNEAPSALPLGELALRYYFSRNQVTKERAFCDAARAASPGACEGVSVTLFATSSALADTFVEVRFAGAEMLAPGAATAELPLTVEPTDGASYVPADDYSFSASTVLTENARVTVHRRSVVVFGTAP